jgi:hypothetical protein
MVGDTDVMREQYNELVGLAALPNVTVQVLPQTLREHLSVHDFAILHLDDGGR